MSMTHVKSLLGGFILAIALALCMSGVAFAEGSITVENAQDGGSYKAYKILDLESYDSSSEAYSYIVASGWENFVNAPGAGSEYLEVKNGYVSWTKEDTDENKAKFIAAALEFASANSIDPTGVSEVDGGNIVIKDLPLGYYVVSSTTGTLCNLTTAIPDATFKDKNSAPGLEKFVEEDSSKQFVEKNTADVIDVISYKTVITAGKGAQGYKLTEVLPKGLELVEGSVKVFMGNAADPDTSYVPNTSTGEFSIDFADAELEENETITVTFEAQFASTGGYEVGNPGNIATATLQYGNGTGDDQMSVSKQTTTRTFALAIFKYTDKDGVESPLSGATFILKNADGKYAKFTGERLVNWVDSADDEATRFTSGAYGTVSVSGFDDDTYTLEEVAAPQGYNKLAEERSITLLENTGVLGEAGKMDGKNQLKVLNNTGSLLPSTGGMGTIAFTVVGLILIVGAGALLVSKLRAKRN